MDNKPVDLKARAAEKRAARNQNGTAILGRDVLFDPTKIPISVEGGPGGLIYTAGALTPIGLERLSSYKFLARKMIGEMWETDESGSWVFVDDDDSIEFDLTWFYIRELLCPVLAADINNVLSLKSALAWNKSETMDFLVKCQEAAYKLNPTVDPTYQPDGAAQEDTKNADGTTKTEEEAAEKN